MDTTTCPNCEKPTPKNEMAAYGRCEDCYNHDRPGTGGTMGNRFAGWRDSGHQVKKPRAPY